MAHKCHGTYTKSRNNHANSRHNRANSRHNYDNSWHNRESFNTAEVKCHGGSEKKQQRHSVQNDGIGDDLGDEILEEDDEEGFMHYYFFRALHEYKEIRLLLLKNHNTEISLSTLKRRIKRYEIKRRRPD